jgi:hypothetical protein
MAVALWASIEYLGKHKLMQNVTHEDNVYVQ